MFVAVTSHCLYAIAGSMMSPGLLSLGSGGTFSVAASQVDYYTEEHADDDNDEPASPRAQVRRMTMTSQRRYGLK